MLLSAADGPAATKLFGDLGVLAIPFEATAAIGDIHYLAAGDGNQTSVVEAWAPVYTGGFGRSTSTNRWRRGRKPPTAIRMALRFPGPGPREHEPSSGMMGKDSMSSAMNIWEVKCGEVHPRGRNSAVAGCCRQQPVEPAAAGATPDSKGAVRRVRSITGPPTLRSVEGQHCVPTQPGRPRAADHRVPSDWLVRGIAGTAPKLPR